MVHKISRLLAFCLTAALLLTISVSVGADEDGYDYGTYEDTAYYTDDDTYHDTYYGEDDTNTDEETSFEENGSSVEEMDEDEYERQQRALEEEKRALLEELHLTEEELEAKRQTVAELQQQISGLRERVADANGRIRTLNEEIAEKQRQLAAKQADIEEVLNLLRVRLRAIHTAGDTSSLEIILGAKNFADFLDKAEMMQSMASYDANLIDTIEAQAAVIADDKKALQDTKVTAEKEKDQLEKDKTAIDKLLTENTQLVEQLMTNQQRLQNEQANNTARQEQLEKAWEAYQEEQERKAAELAEKEETVIVTPSSDGKYVWPCPGFTYLTSTFDEWRGVNNHGALDIAEAGIYGAKVVACYDGVVFSTWEYCNHDYGKDSSCGCGGGYGNYVMIDHGNGKISIYGHLSGVTVTPGQSVKAGQLVGYVGSTGYSTGAHLHFETRYNNVRYDPLSEYGEG